MFIVKKGFFSRDSPPRWTYDVDVHYKDKLIAMVSFTHKQTDGQFWIQDNDTWDEMDFTATEMNYIIQIAHDYFQKNAFPK